MASTSTEIVQDWIANRILTFFNQAQDVSDILDGTIMDDPTDGPGRTIGPRLAARILRERNKLQRRRFTDFEQLDSIRGVGEGTIKDLVYTFGVPAAEAFRRSMYDGVIFEENWPLEYFRAQFEDIEVFNKLVNDEKTFRKWVAEQIGKISDEREVKKEDRDAMQEMIRTAYIDTYHNTIPAPGYALALWFYEFDADNWFSWEQIQEETLEYFDYHMDSHPWDMELRFFRGFLQRGIIRPGITPPDLPVIVNWPERVITIWVSALYD